MNIKNWVWTGITLLSLVGCGGSGGGDAPTSPPAPVMRSGEIDASYGTSGVVQLPVSERFREMAVGRDGSVFVTGDSILKLSPAGSVALDYGQAGRVAMPGDSPVVDGGGSLHVISGMEVVKLDPSGRLDSSFGSGGRAVMGPGVTPHVRLDRIARDLQGNLYVAGVTGTFIQVVVSRLLPDGRIDTTFGSSGSSMAPVTGYSRVEALTVDDEMNVAIGVALLSIGAGAPSRVRIAKLDGNGAPVASFGSAGAWSPALTCSSTYVRALAPLPSGELAWGGSCLVPNLSLFRATNGKVDRGGNDIASFRDGGFTLFGPTTPGGLVVESQWVNALLPAGGNLYAAGHRRGGLTCTQGAVTKLDAGGNAIPDFGLGGYVALDTINDIHSMGMDAAGRLYLGGTRFTDCVATERPFVVTRLGG